MKKTITLLFALLLVFSLCSCKDSEIEEETTTETEISEAETETADEPAEKKITLAYFSNDSINPFKACGKTNAALSELYCDSLVRLKSDFSPVYSLAESIEKDGKSLTVKLKSGIKFSSGASLGGSDVVYSFNLAKESEIYGGRLGVFSGAVANGKTVIFSLEMDDIYAENCLDFPIIQSGTGEEDIVTGSGPYVLKKSGNDYTMKKNTKYSFSEEYEYSISKIGLIDISSVENPLYSVQIGDLSYFYDDLSIEAEERVKVNANTIRIPQNDLVFLGFNSSSAKITAAFRKAVNFALDREHLTNSAFGMGAEAAASVFNPFWSSLEKVKTNIVKSSSAAAQTALIDAGYRLIGSDIYTEGGERLYLKLIVPESDARKTKLAGEIKSALQKAGINIEVNSVGSDEYFSSLRYGLYDMYIGETRLCSDMNLSPFFSEAGSLHYGIDAPTLKESAFSFMRGELDIQTFIDLFDEECPFVPICYVNGIAYYSRLLDIEETGTENSIYYNIYSWEM